MITIKHGSIFDSTAADVLVCPVNCVGVMGKGLALEFKRRWPHACHDYFCACKIGVSAGDVLDAGKVWFAFTKDHWRYPSRIEWVNACLASIAEAPPKSIAIPQLGCGCGGIDWADVWPLYEKHLGGLDCDVEVWIYE